MTWQYNGYGKPILRYETAHHKNGRKKPLTEFCSCPATLILTLLFQKSTLKTHICQFQENSGIILYNVRTDQKHDSGSRGVGFHC